VTTQWHSGAHDDPRPAPSPRPPLSALRPPRHRTAHGHARGTVVTRDVAVGACASGRPAHPSGARRARRATDSAPGDVLVCGAHDARRGPGAGAGPLLSAERDLARDGTWLRGSTRDATDALRSVTRAGVTAGQVWAQRAAPDGDEWAAALARLEAFPRDGKVISADAGLRRPPFVQNAVEQKGVTLGSSSPISPTSGPRALDRDAGRAGARSRADGHTPRTGRAPGAVDGAVRRPQPVAGTSVRLARRAVVRLDRTDALARRTGSNALPRLDCRRCLSLALDPRRRARPAAGPPDDGKPGLSGA
jgi:hypothetical protein